MRTLFQPISILYFVFAVCVEVLPLWAQEAHAVWDAFPKASYHELRSGDRRIGKTTSRFQKKDQLLHFEEQSVMRITLFKTQQELSTQLKAVTSTDLQLQEFEYEMKSKDSQLQIRGRRQGNQLRIEKIQAGQSQIKDLFIQEPLLLSPMIRAYVVSQGLPSEGSRTFEAQLLEPSALTNIPMTIEVQPRKGSRTYDLRIEYLTHELKSQMDRTGRLLEERTEIAGMPVIAKPVSAEQYAQLQLKSTEMDLVEQARVRFPRLPNARELSTLTVEISGINLQNFQLNRHRQSLKGNQLTITKEKPPFQSAPAQSLVGRNDLQNYLKAEISIPVFDPKIQRKALELVGEESDLYQRALKIHQFVNSHLKKDPYVSLPDALEALEKGQGDCNEHATLFTALARAAGVPTRIVVGLVYSDSFYGGGQTGFYYHAWVEVFTGHEWVSMDPTWNQAPVDVTHIAFVEGGTDQQIQIASLMGRIELKRAENVR